MNTQAKMEATVENEVQVDVVTKEKVMSLLVMQNRSKFWDQLLLTDDLSLERAFFFAIISLSSSKPHRNLMMQSVILITKYLHTSFQ
jgi:hypothetical protein